ncbi:MAG: hypothetical protein ABIK09_19675 [Pseudomonadota bacterium]
MKPRTRYLVLPAYLTLIAVVLFPVLQAPSTYAVGDAHNDVWPAIWGIWWTQENLLSLLCLDTHTYLLFFPSGVDLHTHFPVFLSQFFALPFLLVLSPVVSWNLTVYTVLTLNCVSMYALALHVVEDRAASFLAGLLFGLNAYVLGHLHNGSPEHITLFFIPLTILSLVKLVEQPRLRRGVITGVLLLLATLSSWYYGFYLGLFACLYVGAKALHLRGPARRKLLVAAGFAAAVYAVTVTPFLYPLMKNTIFAKPSNTIAWSQLHFVTDVAAFFAPGKATLDPSIRYYLKPVYIGSLCLLLCGLSLSRDCRKQTATLGWLSLVFFVLTLGSNLSIFGHVFESIPLPSRLLPAIGTYRAHALNLALFGLLAGFGFKSLTHRMKSGRARDAVKWLVPAAVIAEALFLSPGPFPVPKTAMAVPAAYQTLAADEESYGIIEVPFDLSDHILCGRYQFYQTVHRKPLVSGATYFLPSDSGSDVWDYIKDNAVLDLLFDLPHQRRSTTLRKSDSSLADAFQQLGADGFRYIIIHRRHLRPGTLANLDALLTRHLGPDARRTEDDIDLWRL